MSDQSKIRRGEPTVQRPCPKCGYVTCLDLTSPSLQRPVIALQPKPMTGEWTSDELVECVNGVGYKELARRINTALAAEERRANDSIKENVRLMNQLAAEREMRKRAEIKAGDNLIDAAIADAVNESEKQWEREKRDLNTAHQECIQWRDEKIETLAAAQQPLVDGINEIAVDCEEVARMSGIEDAEKRTWASIAKRLRHLAKVKVAK